MKNIKLCKFLRSISATAIAGSAVLTVHNPFLM